MQFEELRVNWNKEWEKVAQRLDKAPYNFTKLELNANPYRLGWALKQEMDSKNYEAAEALVSAASPDTLKQVPLWTKPEILSICPEKLLILVQKGLWTDVKCYRYPGDSGAQNNR